MFGSKFWIFFNLIALIHSYNFSNKTNCQTITSTEIQKINTNSYTTEAIKPHKIFQVITNFLGVFNHNEKSLKSKKYKKFESPIDCYNEGCQFLTVYHYVSLEKNEFDYFQTKDSIDKLGCILNNKVYPMIICNQIFEKLNLKQFESPKIKPKYIKCIQMGYLLSHPHFSVLFL